MLDASTIITIIPPIITAFLAYLIAKKRYIISEKINKAKLDSNIQSQALEIVRGVMADMKKEFQIEIESLKDENRSLRGRIDDSNMKIENLQLKLTTSDNIISSLKSEIAALQITVELYKRELKRLGKSDVI